jgi:peptidoglycan/LPS O-acetylase OafA/YrhL
VDEFTLGHRRSLDGVRGLAIVFVLLSHVQSLPLQGGFIGVDLFFVLSGFLITTLLLEERRETGDIRLGDFYARRALRLLPALAAMLLVMVGLSAWRESAEEAAKMRTSALMTFFYSANWFAAFKALPRAELSSAWSLSVEEQFYLVWPPLLRVLLRANVSRKTLAGLAAAGLVLSAGWRAWLWRSTGSFERVFYGSDTHADGLLSGALAALLVSGGALRPTPAVTRALNWGAHLTLGLLLIFLPWGWAADDYALEGGILVLNLGMTAMVLSLLFSPGPILRRCFEFAPLVWLGKVSYGLYLWHMVVFGMRDRLPLRDAIASWPMMLAATAALAALSYVGLERPLLRLKRRFERVRPTVP